MKRAMTSALRILLTTSLTATVLAGCGDSQMPKADPASTETKTTKQEPAPESTAFEPQVQGPRLVVVAEKPWVNDQGVTETTTHDFGDVWDLGSVTTRFQMQNVGSQPVILYQAKPSCGCTSATMTKTRLEPGEKGELVAVFDPLGQNRQTKGIGLVSNCSVEPTRNLKITSIVKPFVQVVPRYMRLDPFLLGEGGRASFVINPVGDDYEINNVTTSSAVGTGSRWVTARLMEAGETRRTHLGTNVVVPEGQLAIELVISPDAPWGGLYVAAEVHGSALDPVTNERLEHTAKMNLATSIYGELHASENMLRANLVKPGDPIATEVTLTNVHGSSFTIKSTEIENAMPPNIQLTAVPVAGSDGSAYTLKVSGTTGGYIGKIGGTAVIRTDVPGEEELRLEINGIIRHVPGK